MCEAWLAVTALAVAAYAWLVRRGGAETEDRRLLSERQAHGQARARLGNALREVEALKDRCIALELELKAERETLRQVKGVFKRAVFDGE
jgi:hypothetical protein